MKKILLSAIATFSLLNAANLEQIVQEALSNNYELKSIEKSIDVANAQLKISKNWENPVLTLGANDIWFDRPFDRDKEAMQAQFIGITQAIPINNKFDILENIASSDKQINEINLEDKKLELKSKIYEYTYSILVLEEKLKLLNEYESNVKKLEKFFTALYKYQKADLNEILNSQVSFENIKLKKQSLENMIKNSYLKLKQITFTKISSIDESLDLGNKIFSKDIKEHPKLKFLNKNIEKQYQMSDLEEAKKYSDIKVNFAYFQRDDRFEDYANISVSIPLSIHNTEDVKSLSSKLKANEIKDKLTNLEHNLSLQIDILENNLDNSVLNHNLIQKKILPLQKKIQKNLENYNSFSKVKPAESIKNLNELISYELKALDEVQNYYENYSKLIYLTQEDN